MERQRGTWMSSSLWVALAIHEMRKQNILIYLFLLRNHSLDASCAPVGFISRIWGEKTAELGFGWDSLRSSPVFTQRQPDVLRGLRALDEADWSMKAWCALYQWLSFNIKKKKLAGIEVTASNAFPSSNPRGVQADDRLINWCGRSASRAVVRRYKVALSLKSCFLCLHWPYLLWRVRARPQSSGIGMLTYSERWTMLLER